jgi:hypothetical protein
MVLAIALIVLVLFEFASFAIGAYYVYDQNVSYVSAQTTTSNQNTYLNITATGLTNNTSRTIWIDPSIAYDSSGNAYANVNSGYRIANVTTSPDGTVSGMYLISSGTLQQIESDGQKIHYVWIAGIGQTQLQGQPGYLNLSSDSSQNYTTATTGAGITLFATLFTFVLPINFNLGQLFLFLWTVYLVLFAIALNGPFRSIIGAIRAASTRGIQALMSNSMLATVLVFPVVLWGTVAISLIQQAGGISTGSLPPIDPLLEFVELAIAPLREEIGFRVIPIGVAALIILISKGRLRDGLLALWHPSRYLKKCDSPPQYKRHLYVMYAMIALSAILFGIAHVLLGAGWGPGKIASAAVAGIALGGLYYVYGLPSAILLHWSIDYFLTAFGFNNQILTDVYGFVTLYTIVLAAAGSIVLILLLIRKLRKSPLETYSSTWGSSVR